MGISVQKIFFVVSTITMDVLKYLKYFFLICLFFENLVFSVLTFSTPLFL